jgi:hypothetical protein
MSSHSENEMEKWVRSIVRDELKSGVSDGQGREWSLQDMLSLGLTRREAVYALGAIASGYAVREAIVSGVGTASAAASGSVGVANNRVDVFADQLDANTLAADLAGNSKQITGLSKVGTAALDTTGDITDTGNSITVYDQSTKTVGDGTTTASHTSVSTIDLFADQLDITGDITDTGNSITVYDQSTKTVGDGTTTASHTSVSTDEADITNETNVRAHLSSNQSYSTSNGLVTLALDSEGIDTRSEFDTTNNQFSPDNNGEYLVNMSVRFGVAADGDTLRIIFRNTTDSTSVIEKQMSAGSSDFHTVTSGKVVNLNSSKSYQILVENANNDDTIDSNNFATYLSIRSAFA